MEQAACSVGASANQHPLATFLYLQSGRPEAPPPASKRVIASLPVEDVTAETMSRLGPGAQCAVCTEDLAVGDKVQVRPVVYCRNALRDNAVRNSDDD